MQTVILAGGLGTRLRPITEKTPKPMVEVGGRPFLEYIIHHLEQQGFRRLLLLIGYLGEHVEAHFGDGREWGVRIDYCREMTPLGTGGALRNALGHLAEEFLLLYGDSYLPIDYRRVVKVFRSTRSSALMVVYDNNLTDTGVKNNVAIDDDRYVTRYDKVGLNPELKYVEAGALCFQRHVFESLRSGKVISLEQSLFSRLIARRELRGFITSQRFYDIGTPERLLEFESIRQ